MPDIRKKFNESNKRSLAKAITYRLYQSFIITPIIAYLLTNNPSFALKFGIIEFAIKIPAYYVFERIWALIPHGYKNR
ncbi:MAG: DUF2061 domain-containing protein [Staphylothermus sp.]|nr:DUF2061 domain-containing protein [Staphylothermus sp.]